MASKGIKALILTFVSKTGQSVMHDRHNTEYFLLEFCIRDRICLGTLPA